MENSNNCECNKEGDKPTLKSSNSKSRPIYSFGISFLIAFFPKCPFCWATYMSLLGGIGLANIPYQKWLLPLLSFFLIIHIYFLWRKIKEKGLGPILLTLFGVSILVFIRVFEISIILPSILAILAITMGSLWNNFKWKRENQIFTKTY